MKGKTNIMDTINIKSRLEPLWDYYLVDKHATTARLSANAPEKKECVIRHDKAWEYVVNYHVIFKDGDIYRMYYTSCKKVKDEGNNKLNETDCFICYAESRDGVYWDKPDLSIYGHNNIIVKHPTEPVAGLFVFKDTNPDCPSSELYKGIVRMENGCKVFSEGGALVLYVSPDGIHFKRAENILNEPGKYDSLNVAFWDEAEKEYRLYFRDFEIGLRSVKLMTSKDFKSWESHGFILFDDDEKFQLYTNNIRVYSSAPHVFIGFPTRYTERKEWTPSYDALPGLEDRKWRCSMDPRYGLALTDALFMVSRDGINWHKFNESILDAGAEEGLNWVYGDGYFSYACIEGDDGLSLFSTVGDSWNNGKTCLRRHLFRKDGFASFKSGWEKSKIVTKPFTFCGSKLFLNFKTSAAGSIRIKISEKNGNTTQSCEIFGNSTRREIVFDCPLDDFSRKKVKMEMEMQDAEVFSFRFC